MKISLKQIHKICMMLCFAFISVTAFAQSVINGVVTNVKDGMPAQGVTVSVKGTIEEFRHGSIRRRNGWQVTPGKPGA